MSGGKTGSDASFGFSHWTIWGVARAHGSRGDRMGCASGLKIARPLSLIGAVPSVAIFTVLALVELVADKLPQTPSRTALPGLTAHILLGGLTGACVAVPEGQGVLLASRSV